MIKYSPWSNPRDPQVFFEIDSYNKLLESLGWSDHREWLNLWLNRGGLELASSNWPLETKSDWIWGLGLPFLSDIERYIFNKKTRTLLGISGLPGCGKTSFGKWIEAASFELNWPVKVISMDDFYLPYPELQQAMLGNPWGAPRALPGSHAIKLMEETIETWESTGNLKAPQFDKALRGGNGDRSGWHFSKPKILVIEGWFLGCSLSSDLNNSGNIVLEYKQSITPAEKEYKVIVQKALRPYQPIWEKFERIWHIKSIDFSSMKKWKIQQEMNLQRDRGASLQAESLELFLRMIEIAIPQADLQSIKSDVLVKLNTSREIKWVGPSK